MKRAGQLNIQKRTKYELKVKNPFNESELYSKLLNQILNHSEVFDWTVNKDHVMAVTYKQGTVQLLQRQWDKELMYAFSKVYKIEKDINKIIRE